MGHITFKETMLWKSIRLQNHVVYKDLPIASTSLIYVVQFLKGLRGGICNGFIGVKILPKEVFKCSPIQNYLGAPKDYLGAQLYKDSTFPLLTLKLLALDREETTGTSSARNDRQLS